MTAGRAARLRLRRTSDDAVLCAGLVVGTSFWQRLRGLMFRASLADGEALYLPDSSIHMMFMRFPIDALFVGPEEGDGSRAVVARRDALPPWRGIVLPVRGARAVIEMAAGTLASHGVAVGDRVVMEPALEDGPARP